MFLKILLLGKNGQVGSELQHTLSSLGNLIALDRNSDFGYCGDLSNLDGITQTIRELKPDIVINAAAYTAVDRAEDDRAQSLLINALAPARIAAEVLALDGLFVHYSSDYVFDGSGSIGRKESDPTGPLNFYGVSKLAGEQAVSDSGCKHLILRTSWFYGFSGKNIIKRIVSLAKKNTELSIVDDQFGVPTGADFLADVTVQILNKVLKDPGLSGLYHLVPVGETSWYEYAKYVINSSQDLGVIFSLKNLLPVSSHMYPVRAQRPLNSRLDTKKISDTFSLDLPDWKSGVLYFLKETYKEVV